ncbi:hypothetical protein K474DRAFT_1705299 [Panus rudis PR-1116 ss-1]|nr:hypothetical protein K474DRAFT_1705299 [Panus rudis PR-1116 ss-1]
MSGITAADLVRRMMEPVNPWGLSATQRKEVETLWPAAEQSSASGIFTDTILNPTWMDRSTVFWGVARRPQMRPEHRRFVEVALEHAYARREGVLAPLTNATSCCSYQSTPGSTYTALSNSDGHPPAPSSITSYASASSPHTPAHAMAGVEREMKRRKLLEDLLHQEVATERAMLPIHMPKPQRIIHIPFLDAGAIESPKAKSRRTSRLSQRVEPPPPLNISLVRDYIDWEREVGQTYEFVDEDGDEDACPDSNSEWLDEEESDFESLFGEEDDMDGVEEPESEEKQQPFSLGGSFMFAGAEALAQLYPEQASDCNSAGYRSDVTCLVYSPWERDDEEWGRPW